MDVSCDIPFKLSYYCVFLLYELMLSLYSIHSRVYSSLKSYFYPQLKAQCKIGSHPSHGYHHRNDILMMMSNHWYHRHLFSYQSWQFFICFSLLWFCFSGPFVYSRRASLGCNRSFMRVISSSTNCIKSWRSGSRICFLLTTFTVLFHLSINHPGNFEISIHNISGVSSAFQSWLSDWYTPTLQQEVIKFMKSLCIFKL